MLYLEDYIELIEQLPQDLRDRFTDMRERDLKVQNTVDTLDMRVRRFFSDAQKSKNEQIQEDYKNVHHCYKLALDDADEKVSMASHIYDLVDRHLRKLDQELSRFKMELEADCSGITETLEKRSVVSGEERSLDLLYNSTFNTSGLENPKKKFGDIDRFSTANLSNGVTEKLYSCSYNPLGTSYPLVKSNSSLTHTQSANHSQKPIGFAQQSSSNLSTKSLETKDPIRQGIPSTKSMTAAQRKAEQLGNSLSLSGLLAASVAKPLNNLSNSPSPSAPSNSYVDVTGNYLSSSTPPSSNIQQKHAGLQNRQQKAGRRTHKTMASLQVIHPQTDKSYQEGASLDWTPDPNEPTYCLCNQVSYGEMVGCDNPSCPIEWFHYGCVGLTDAPKGKWYCPDCSVQVKKRRIR